MKFWRAFFLVFIVTCTSQSHATPAAFPDFANLPLQTNMPDVFSMNDGTKVTTPKQWRARREEMKAMLEYYELGHAPPSPGNVKGKVLCSANYLNCTAQYRLVHLSFGPHHKLGFDIAIFLPAREEPFPTIIFPAFTMTPGVNFTNGLITTNRSLLSRPVDPAQAALNFSNQLARGYAIVTWRYTECGVDNATFRTNAYYPAYPGYDWGELRGWAWGLSRVVDYVEKQPFADKTKIIAVGHSRLGKMVMVAGAFDNRISLVAPAGSGCAGTGAFRFCGPGRGGKQGIESMTGQAPYWFASRFREFAAQVQKLPFDEHWYVALTAPRPWITAEGTEDKYCLPNAAQQTVLAARSIYQTLGLSPDRVGANYEVHIHELTTADWNAILDFADQQLRGIDHHRTFDQPPLSNASTNSIPSK